MWNQTQILFNQPFYQNWENFIYVNNFNDIESYFKSLVFQSTLWIINKLFYEQVMNNKLIDNLIYKKLLFNQIVDIINSNIRFNYKFKVTNKYFITNYSRFFYQRGKYIELNKNI